MMYGWVVPRRTRSGRLLTLWARYFRPGGASPAFAQKWLVAGCEAVACGFRPPASRGGPFLPLFVTFSCEVSPTSSHGTPFPSHGTEFPSHRTPFPRLVAPTGPHESGAGGLAARWKGREGLSLFGPILTVCQIAHSARRRVAAAGRGALPAALFGARNGPGSQKNG